MVVNTMKRVTVFAFLLISVSAYADECENHLAYASAGTSVVSTANGQSAQNGAVAYAIFNPFPCTSTGIAFPIKVVDSSSSNYYGFALVGVRGNVTPGLVYATTGALTGPAFTSSGVGGVQALQWQGGPISLPVGMYMLVLGTTCPSTCAQLFGDSTYGHFYSFIYPNTSANDPWTFNSAGFSGFSSVNMPQVLMNLDPNSTQTIMGTTATVIPTGTNVANVFVSGVITVQGVTTSGANGFNCTGCVVTAVNTSTGAISYTVPSTAQPFSGNINSGATLAVSPVMMQQAKFVAPTALIY
jgi:hypothetical protein